MFRAFDLAVPLFEIPLRKTPAMFRLTVSPEVPPLCITACCPLPLGSCPAWPASRLQQPHRAAPWHPRLPLLEVICLLSSACTFQILCELRNLGGQPLIWAPFTVTCNSSLTLCLPCGPRVPREQGAVGAPQMFEVCMHEFSCFQRAVGTRRRMLTLSLQS